MADGEGPWRDDVKGRAVLAACLIWVLRRYPEVRDPYEVYCGACLIETFFKAELEALGGGSAP